MEFEVLKKSHNKEIIIGISVFVVIAIVLIVKGAFAKYELVKSIKIAEGTINYKVPDFKIMAMYKNDGNGDIEIDTMPETGYIINESKTYCEVNENKDVNAKLYTDTSGHHIISNLSKSSKCYIYFDKAKKVETALGVITVKLMPVNYNKTAQKTCKGIEVPCEETNGIFASNDNDGETYYYRGTVGNNYLKFAGFWWRIIRINGDGSIRLIYDGTSGHANGSISDNSIITQTSFTVERNDNAYVGFKYTVGELRGLGTKSLALEKLENWYKSNLDNNALKIDINAGFCGDRTPSTSNTTSNGLGGTGTTTTYYDEYIRLLINKSPVLTCVNSSDLYTTNNSSKGNKSLTYPIGLITADEVVMAGGIDENQQYYLYNGQEYWTITPSRYDGINNATFNFTVNEQGRVSNGWTTSAFGLRPVINLSSNVKITGSGTLSDPYVVS